MLSRRRPIPEAAKRKIADPAAHAELLEPGPWETAAECRTWEPWAARYTTLDFREVDGVRYYNNCGPTAVTNLVLMGRRRFLGPGATSQTARSIYNRTARYGTGHLFFINSDHRLFHGTSDLRAGSFLRRMTRRLLGLRLRLRFHLARWRPIRRALDRGALVYLMLWNHPAYHSHHLLCYGYRLLRNARTGEERPYLLVADGHTGAPRYLDLGTVRGACWEVRFPEAEAEQA